MAQTGQNLYKYLQQKVGQAYSGYLDTVKADRLFKEALIKSIEIKYYQDPDQKDKDDISTVLKANKVFVPKNNVLNTQALQIINVAIYSPFSFLITTTLPHGFTTGQNVIISGILGTGAMTSANGTFAVQAVSNTSFSIAVPTATGVYTANSGKITSTYTISDYWHLLAVKAKFSTIFYGYTITDATNTAPIVLTFNKRNPFRSQDYLNIAGVTGNTNANGNYYLKKLNDFKGALYADTNFQIPIAGNGAYVSGGAISNITYNYCTPYISEQKISVIVKPTATDPSFEISDNLIRIYPLDLTCSEVTADYISLPPAYIITTDNTLDLTLFYPDKFLYYVADTAARLFALQIRDSELYTGENNEQVKNP